MRSWIKRFNDPDACFSYLNSLRDDKIDYKRKFMFKKITSCLVSFEDDKPTYFTCFYKGWLGVKRLYHEDLCSGTLEGVVRTI
ncbi:hypothetical protein KY345_00945 [Candidatus Woesearchaeota archaeon]|nr:hypothetical protein [Candidatus Woesearchaeota archaeon]